MTTLAAYEAEQDRLQARAYVAEANERPTRRERDDLIVMADRCERRAEAVGDAVMVDYWSAVRASAPTGGRMPRTPQEGLADHEV